MMRDIFARAFPTDPRIIKHKLDTAAGMKLGGLSADLIGNRSGWYEFREKMMRGYARMRASNRALSLRLSTRLSSAASTPNRPIGLSAAQAAMFSSVSN